MISNDRVLAAGMASSAVGVENLLARVEVASESRGSHKEGSAGSGDLRHVVLLAGHAHAGSLRSIRSKIKHVIFALFLLLHKLNVRSSSKLYAIIGSYRGPESPRGGRIEGSSGGNNGEGDRGSEHLDCSFDMQVDLYRRSNFFFVTSNKRFGHHKPARAGPHCNLTTRMAPC